MDKKGWTFMKGNKINIILFLGIVIILNFTIFKLCDFKNNNFSFSYNLSCNTNDSFQIFHSKNDEWIEENSQRLQYSEPGKEVKMSYSVPDDSLKLRIDLGEQKENVSISDISVENFGKKINLDVNKFYDGRNQEDLGNTKIENGVLTIDTNVMDPYLVYNLNGSEISTLMENENSINMAFKIFICIVIDILLIFVARKSKSARQMFVDLYNNRRLIWNLSKNDFKTKYAGSYLGITWAFVQPVVTILVYWFVFQYGLKSGSPIPNVPFALWFITGLIPWFFFLEALTNATNCMLEYSYLVKKVVFKITILPIVKIVSSFFVHLAFVGFLILLFIIYIVSGMYQGFNSIYLVQLLYYSFCIFAFVLGLSYITASIVVFFKDLGQIINIILQIGMWMTPIMWSYTIMPIKYQWIVKINPLFYIVDGYRDTLINHVWFWNKGIQTVDFWIITLAIFLLGALIFKKLKPHFADVL